MSNLELSSLSPGDAVAVGRTILRVAESPQRNFGNCQVGPSFLLQQTPTCQN